MMRIVEIRRLKLPSSSMESLTHQFLQRCPVSGTAKGKSKIKTGQPLKRSKVTTKKSTSSGGGDGGGGGHQRESEFDKMVNACMTATSPVRHLTPKGREREARREKMGLMSEARKTEIENLKKNVASQFNSSTIIGTPGLDLVSLGVVDGDEIPKYDLTVDDGRRLAKEYSRVLMRKHRARQKAETMLLRLKKEAIEALPEGLKAAALVPDLSPFPVNRFMATLTPPIEGYIEKIKEAAKKRAGKEKLR